MFTSTPFMIKKEYKTFQDRIDLAAPQNGCENYILNRSITLGSYPKQSIQCTLNDTVASSPANIAYPTDMTQADVLNNTIQAGIHQHDNTELYPQENKPIIERKVKKRKKKHHRKKHRANRIETLDDTQFENSTNHTHITYVKASEIGTGSTRRNKKNKKANKAYSHQEANPLPGVYQPDASLISIPNTNCESLGPLERTGNGSKNDNHFSEPNFIIKTSQHHEINHTQNGCLQKPVVDFDLAAKNQSDMAYQGEDKKQAVSKADNLQQGAVLLSRTTTYLNFDHAIANMNSLTPEEIESLYRDSKPCEKSHKKIAVQPSGDLRREWSAFMKDMDPDDEFLDWVKEQFMNVAGEDNEIDKKEFKRAMGIKDTFFNDRFFDLFDTEKSGTLDLKEFTAAMTLLAKGGPHDKMAFLFQVYDVDGSGSIDVSELKTVLRHCIMESSMQLSEKVLEDLAQTLFESADTDQSGLISLEELCAVLDKYPDLTDNLTISAAGWMKKKNKDKSKEKKLPLHTRITNYIANNKLLCSWGTVYSVINIGLFLTSLRYIETNIAVVIARGCGMCLNFNCSLVLVLMLRYTLTWLRETKIGPYLPIDWHVLLHRIVGYVIVLLTAVHTIAHLVNIAIVLQSSDNKLTYTDYLFSLKSKIGLIPGFAYLSGVILFVLLAIMFTCALPFIRKNGYFQVFYFTHLLYIIFWITLLMHGPIFWIFFIIPGIIFILEKTVPVVKRKIKKQEFFISEVNLLPSKVTHLVISRPEGFEYRPGDYIFIKFPKIATHEYHPFTISSAPEMKDTFWLHVRGVGSWTKSLYKYFEEYERNASDKTHLGNGRGAKVMNGNLKNVVVTNGNKPASKGDAMKMKQDSHKTGLREQVSIKGPYGTPTREIFESEHAVLIGSGIGVTPFASILQSICHKFKAQKISNIKTEEPMKLKKVDFIWVNREQQAFQWFIALLSKFEAEENNAEDFDEFFDMEMYMTSALSMNDMKGLGIQMALDAMHKKEKKDVVTGLKTRVQPGRPKWNQVFKRIAGENKGKVNVFFCGSPLLAKTLKAHCDQFNFEFSKEEF